MADELLQFLGLEGKPVLTQFIEEVANKGLQQYQRVIQWGEHHGQSLYNHIISGVFLIHTLQEVLQLNEEGLTEEELKTLTIAFCIHDLNKTYEGQETSYSRVATPENIAKEIEKIGFDGFFSDWLDYIADITELARGHSGHNSVRGDSLDRRSDITRIGKSRLNKLCEIIRAVDVADLSHSYSEHKHKQTFLSHFNSFSQKQYRLIAHQVSEQRGVLTNIIHNQVSKFLYERFYALPIFLYPKGTHYLVPVEVKLELAQNDWLSIGELVENKINQMKREEFDKYINNTPAGIKIKAEILKLGIPLNDIFGYVNSKIQSKYNNSDNSSRLGELLRTFYIFLSDHCKGTIKSTQQEILKQYKQEKNVSWKYIYHVFEVQDPAKYATLHVLNERAYIVAQDLLIEYEDVLSLIIQKASALTDLEKQEERVTSSDKKTSPLINYVQNSLTFDFIKFSVRDFSGNLKMYCNNNHKQSCYSSSPFQTSKWESGYVPRGVKVQQFSNRLVGGSLAEPKRYVDPIVQYQFSIEKLNFSSAGSKFLYLHLMPYSFMTVPFIESFKKFFQELRRVDTSAVSLTIREVIKFFDANKYCILPIKSQKSEGILVPKYSELVGNIISLPINPTGDNSTERYLNGIEYALLIRKYFSVKVLLSELSIPILDLTEHDEIDIFLDGVPSSLRGLVKSEELHFQRNPAQESIGSGDVLWQRFLAIREIYDFLHIIPKKKKNESGKRNKSGNLAELYILATAFSNSENHFFFEVDRLIEKKAEEINKKNKDNIAIDLSRKLGKSIEKIVTVGSSI